MESKQETTKFSVNATSKTSSWVPPTHEHQLPLHRVIAMGKGDGQDSYHKNSTLQSLLAKELVLPHLDEALDQVTLPVHGSVVVADLGCSSGPNTISSVSHIVKKLRARFPGTPSLPTEFQVFFNDLPSTDFNNLFQLLTGGSEDNFFAAGVPGSFHDRLFLSSSVHLFFSTFALHWISKIPDAVLDKDSPAFNKGRCWIDGSSPATAAAYQEQGSEDLKIFLNARTEELVPGGLMFVVCPGRSSPEPNKPWSGSVVEYGFISMDETWRILVSQGTTTEEQRDTFNIPWYHYTAEELIKAVEDCGSQFHVQTAKIGVLEFNFDRMCPVPEPADQCQKYCGHIKSALATLVEAHIGRDASTVFWQTFERVCVKSLLPKIEHQPEFLCKFVGLIVALTRK